MAENQAQIQQVTAQYGGQLPPELQQQFEIEIAKAQSVCRAVEVTDIAIPHCSAPIILASWDLS